MIATTTTVARLGRPGRPARRGVRPRPATTGVGASTRQISHVAGGRPWGHVVALTIAPWWREDGPIVGTQHFAIRYGVTRPLLSILGLGPAFSGIDLGDDRMKVGMGWGFQASVPRSSVRGAATSPGLVGGIGVHGWNGRWLVNGSTKGLVTIDIDPKARAFVMGFPVRMRKLRVSVENPEELVAALRT